MNATKREIRTLDCKLSVREKAPNEEGESRTISGTAIVFDAESEVLDDWGYRFREVIKPEACTMEFLNSQDVKMNMLHERGLTVARCNKGEGSLRLSVDEKGVNFEFEAPKCDIGDRCLEMVRRGDYSGCSFEFFPEEYDIEEREGGKDVKIIHRKFNAITALTIGMDPAYTQTSVNARELVKHDEPIVEESKEEKTEDPAVEPETTGEPEEPETETNEREDTLKDEIHRRLQVLQRLHDNDF